MKDTFFDKLEGIARRYLEVSELLGEISITQDLDQFKKLSKEYAQLKPITEHFIRYKNVLHALKQNEPLLKEEDSDLKALAIEENATLNEQLKKLKQELQIMLIPEDPDDTRNVFLEIRAAAGGAEATLFAGNLLRMYLRYAEKQKWTTEIISQHPSEQGGYKTVTVRLMGNSVYAHLKFESGAHRVQRVPATETQGRLHTSTCTVAILPEVEMIDEIHLSTDELRIDTFRASGAGGQHVQKTDSAIRITHLPTGLTVECQDERSQHKNRARAMSLLQAKLLADKREQHQKAEAATRRSLVGTGDRSERIRTYNFPQERLTDHRINLTLYQLSLILEGELALVLDPLKHHYQMEQLQGNTSE
jgi:peptide chain release factor 1